MRSPNDTLAPTSLTLALSTCAALAACAPANKAADTSSVTPKNETITHTWYGERGFSYPYELTQRTLAAEEDYPIQWYAEWSWTPSADCSEPNQTHAQATPLELGVPAEGYLRTGYHDGYHFKQMLDVWKVEVPAGGVLTARLKSSPPDLTPSIAIHDAAERNVSFNPTPTSAATEAVPAGTYYVHVGVFMMPRTPVQRKGEGGSFDSIDLPHLTTPYERVVERADPPADAP